jgi:uncharacterized repeat protein (TIGR03803 family)
MLNMSSRTAARFFSILISMMTVLITPSMQAQKFEVLHRFGEPPDGNYPNGLLTLDSTGTLYGVTAYGGDSSCNNGNDVGCGVVYTLSSDGTETILYTFHSDPDANGPSGGLLRGAQGVFYGAAAGGPSNLGTIYKVDKQGNETTLFNFPSFVDGEGPEGALVSGTPGVLYGTTEDGGNSACFGGCGVVYRFDTNGKETTLHSFAGPDGNIPRDGVIRDTEGDLYGVTQQGGAANFGVVYKIDSAGKEKVLHSFKAGSDGAYPESGLVGDASGNLYGTTSQGGRSGCKPYHGCGTVFKLTKSGKGVILHRFTGGVDGSYPEGEALAFDRSGNLYGTTAGGGSGFGVVFELVNSSGRYTEKVLYTFSGGNDGGVPESVTRSANGHLYGVTGYGGDPNCKCGVVFEITP